MQTPLKQHVSLLSHEFLISFYIVVTTSVFTVLYLTADTEVIMSHVWSPSDPAASYFLNRQVWMSSNMASSLFSTSSSGMVTFAPESLLTATH